MAKSESAKEMELAFIKCPICLEEMSNPKSIPCMHTFCESCLSSYIEKQQECLEGQSKLSGFPCPICNRTTLPVDVSADIKLWAKQYPGNTLVVALETIKKIKIKEKLCDPCHKKNQISNPAELWCQECKVFFCNDCKALHDMFSSGHTLISKKRIAENPFEGINHKSQCEKHGETYSFVCVTHHSIACSTCITLNHRHCGKIMTTKEYCQNIKQNEELDSLVHMFDLAIDDMDGLIEVTKNRFTTLEEEKDISEVQMENHHEKLKNHLAKLHESDLEKLYAAYKDEKGKNKKKLKRCEQLKTAMEYSRRTLRTTLQYGDEAAVVSVNEKGKEEFTVYCKSVEEEFKNNATKKLSASPSQHMEQFETAKIISDVVATPTFYQQNLPRVIDVFSYCPQVQAFMEFDGNLPSDASECNFTGLLFIKWNRLVAVDNANKKLKLFTNKGGILSHLVLPHSLWEVCQMDNEHLAVSGCQDKKISFVYTKDDRFLMGRTVNINVEPYGIVFKDQSLLVSSGNTQEGIHCYSVEGVHLHTISASKDVMYLLKLPKSGNLVASKDNTKPHDSLLQLFSNTKDGSAEIILNSECSKVPYNYGSYIPYEESCVVEQVNGLYEPAEIYFGNVYQPVQIQENFVLNPGSYQGARGIAADDQDNIYVCLNTSNHVIMISQDRQTRTLLSQSDGITNPTALSINKNEFVLAEANNNTLKIFRLI